MKTIIPVINLHIPTGELQHKIEFSYKKIYKPIVEAAIKSGINFSLHISAPLIEYLETYEETFMNLIKEGVRNDQIDMMSGGYYEPVLSAVPYEDAVSQVSRMNEYIRKKFGKQPKGAWIVEKSWSNSIIKIANETGIQYTIVDTFKTLNNLTQSDTSPFITEKDGSLLTLFPSTNFNNDIIDDMEKMITLFETKLSHIENIFLSFELNRVPLDIIEKMDKNPEHVPAIIHFLADRKRFLTQTYRDSFNLFNIVLPKKKKYMPETSFNEALFYSLRVDEQIELENLISSIPDVNKVNFKFIWFGSWEAFRTKYKETNELLKRMELLFTRMKKIDKKKITIAAIDKAKELLNQSECCSSYYSGPRGGLYYGYLRQNTISNIIKAENILTLTTENTAIIRDFLGEGSEQCFFQSRDYCAAINSKGNFFAYENRAKAFSLSLCMTRQPEYEHTLMKNKEDLIIDSYNKDFTVDLFLAEKPTIEEFRQSKLTQTCELSSRLLKFNVTKNLNEVRAFTRCSLGMKFTKKILFSNHESKIEVEYTFKNESKKNETLSTFFGIEFNINLIDENDPLRKIEVNESSFGLKESFDGKGTKITAVNDWDRFRMKINLSEEADIYSVPLYSYSQGRYEIEKLFQGNSTIAIFNVAVEPGKSKKINFEIILENY